MAQAAKERSHRIRAMVGIATWADLPGTVNKWATPKVIKCKFIVNFDTVLKS